MTSLHHYCLVHIFKFLTPKEWIPFIRVCKSWKVAAVSKELQQFTFDSQTSQPINSYNEKLTFAEFVKILEFVAPKLKYVKIRIIDEDVVVTFGSFGYLMRVSAKERKRMMDIIWKQTKSVEILEMNSFDDATKLEWAQFLQANRLKSLKFQTESLQDHQTFYHDYISLLPNTLEEIVFPWHRYFEEEKIEISHTYVLHLLQRLPRLKNVCLPRALEHDIATELSKHRNTIIKLSIVRIKHESILKSIFVPNFTKLTTMELGGPFLNDENLCRQIVQTCQSLRCLRLVFSTVSEPALRILTSLPNLNEFHMIYSDFTLTEKLKNLNKLIYFVRRNKAPDYENLFDGLTMMPNLATLRLMYLGGKYQDHTMTEAILLKIKRIFHSRGQNVGFYTLERRTNEMTKISEMSCGSNEEFALVECIY